MELARMGWDRQGVLGGWGRDNELEMSLVKIVFFTSIIEVVSKIFLPTKHVQLENIFSSHTNT